MHFQKNQSCYTTHVNDPHLPQNLRNICIYNDELAIACPNLDEEEDEEQSGR